MRRLDEQRAARLAKRDRAREKGINVYPARTARDHSIGNVKKQFKDFEHGKTALVLAGRIVALRPHGGSTFLELEDASGRMQILLQRDVLGDAYAESVKSLDLGDIIETAGTVGRTARGEQTLHATTVRMLAKTLRPLPEQHYGLKDVETRLRKRYLDLLMHPETRELFRKKSVFWSTFRSTLLEQGFLEVETPVLESVPGGAEAEPFRTHHYALDRDLTLRISLELPLKRLLVAGYEKVFEIGRIFRNEGLSPEHLQDYTQLEFYWAYADYRMLMEFLPKLFRAVILATVGDLKVSYDGQEVDWGEPWITYDYYNVFSTYTKIDLAKISDDELRAHAKRMGCALEPYAQRGRIIDQIYKKAVRPKLLKPGFLINPPVEVEPLAKRLEDDPTRVERLQVVAWGTELGKGFSELNDPIDQRKRFEEQMRLREAGDREAQQLDEDFLEALEYGMPPAAGFGVSERLFSYLVDLPIRETTIFPLVKRDEQNSDAHDHA